MSVDVGFSMVVSDVNSRSRFAKFIFVTVLAAVGAASCSGKEGAQPDSEESQVRPASVPVPANLMTAYRFDSITPTGQKVFAASLDWLSGAEKEADSYMVPFGCAKNVSRVLRNAGIRGYSSPLVDVVGNAIADAGGKIVRLPKATKTEKIEFGIKSETYDYSAIIKTINDELGGGIPTGAVVYGCKNQNCTGDAASAHISIVGNIDSSGSLNVYHSNWLRPSRNGFEKYNPRAPETAESLRKEQELKSRIWSSTFVPWEWWYRKGYERKWMPTPWIQFIKGTTGKVTGLSMTTPWLTDHNPGNDYVHIAIMKEILQEQAQGKARKTDGRGKIEAVKP